MDMERTKNDVVRSVTLSYLHEIKDADVNPVKIESELLYRIKIEFEANNAVKEKGHKWITPQTLSFAQIADIMATLYPICRLSCAGANSDEDLDILAIYQEQGYNQGIYVTSEDTFREIATNYNYNLTQKEFTEIMLAIRKKVPRKERCMNKDLIAVNNGIFDYSTKKLIDFSPELIFMTKSKVNYNANATNINIVNPIDNTDWDVESWLQSLSDDSEIVTLLWEILSAIIRPNVRWNKSAWLYSEQGNNGKGTLCELMRQLCGAGSYASIPISDFGKDFLLEPLTRASAIIVDENDVGTFVDHAANLKAVITNDVIQINRKFKIPIAYQFYGFMVQCLNEFPRIKDKSDSFYRRQLFIPMLKCFTGVERRYIKDDYLHRTEVLEYVLKKVLHTNFYVLSEPQACKDVLDTYKEFNDPIRQFFEELSPMFQWDLLPFNFLYDVYKVWFKQNSPSGSPQGKNTFIKDITHIANSSNNWMCIGSDKKIRTGKNMDKPEPLIITYGLDDWKNQNYKGNDKNQICKPTNLAVMYRGITRMNSIINNPDTDTDAPNGNIDNET